MVRGAERRLHADPEDRTASRGRRETAYLELVKTSEQKETERRERIAAAEAREIALKGEATSKKKKGARAEKEEEAAGEAEKPKRGRRKKDEGGAAAPVRKRTRTGVKTG